MNWSRGRPLRLAFIGAGPTNREHAKAFSAIPEVVTCGVHSRTRAKSETFASDFRIPQVCNSIPDLFDRTEADLVVVAVPEVEIASVLAACVRFPWTTFMEKPVGVDLSEAEGIAATAEAAKARVFIGLNRRFLSSTRAALEDIRNDDTPRFIHVQDQQSLDMARALNHPDRVVRNWMYANSIHLVDYLVAFGRGEVTSVERIVPWRPEAPGLVLATVRFTSGDVGLYEGVWHGPGPWACTVTTRRRRWELRPLEKACFQNVGERTLNPVIPHRWDTDFKPGFRLQAEHVIAAVRASPSDAPDLNEAMRSMRLVNSIFSPVRR